MRQRDAGDLRTSMEVRRRLYLPLLSLRVCARVLALLGSRWAVPRHTQRRVWARPLPLLTGGDHGGTVQLSATARTVQTLSSTWRENMPAGYDVHEYKSDVHLRAWVKQVDGRKGRLQARQLRHANQVGSLALSLGASGIRSLHTGTRGALGSVKRKGRRVVC